jgi:dynein heavy chain
MEKTLKIYFVTESQYVSRDPLLFGDFRNAMLEDEPRNYEDLLSYKAVYHIFSEVK